MSKIEIFKNSVARLPRRAGPDLHMEDLMDPALDALPELLKDRNRWGGMYIDYEQPYLMRLFTAVTARAPDETGRRIHLHGHYFFGKPGKDTAEKAGLPNPYAAPGADGKAKRAKTSYHPHPWAATFAQFDGVYDQQIGLAKTLGYSDDPTSPLRPVPFTTITQDAGDPDKSRYTFNNPLIWHAVSPSDGQPTTSLMVTYMPLDWGQIGPRPAQIQRMLEPVEMDFMFAHIEQYISRPTPARTRRPLQPVF
jgi:hypothetical protein